jgi:DNA repair exonuclease SbcCD ATPase subunit
LGYTVSQLQEKIQQWEEKCQELEEDNKCKDEELEKLKENLRKKEKELENMACGIEMARLEKQKQAYNAEYDKKKNRKNRGGVFQWLFGWIYGDDLADIDESDDELEILQVSLYLLLSFDILCTFSNL